MSSGSCSLSMVELNLPPGFRFHPRDDELVCDYLMNKLLIISSTSSPDHHDHHRRPPPLLVEVDLNKCEPWDIPPIACVGGKEWYFYSQRDKKYATGLRTNRATISGYWKATGKDRPVLRKGTLVGMRKTLVFYQGRAPKGRKTNWVMHEFRLEGPNGPPKLSSLKEDWVLCRMFHKNKDDIIPAKQSLPRSAISTIGGGGSYGGGATTNPFSLPPLMEPPYITFDHQTQTNFHDHQQYQQVPCFSIFTNQTDPSANFSQINHMQPNLYSSAGNYNDNIGTHSSSISSELSCDENILKAVLNHVTKMESNYDMVMKDQYSSSFGDQGSSESFLSEVGLATMWNQC